jgi:8-oxo-dGTP pyrophosphatase MutT (NUDIX family)
MLDLLTQRILPLAEPSPKQADFRCAAVLIPLVERAENQWDVIFTRRAEHLKHHPGQISFPGGGYESQDKNLGDTAVRETFEEIGIRAEQVRLIGKLPQQQTISQYNVTPFIGIIDSNYQLKIDYNEVAEVFTAPLEFVIDQTNQQKQTEQFNGRQISYYVIRYKQYNIWGATARILVNLSRRIYQDIDPSNFQ